MERCGLREEAFDFDFAGARALDGQRAESAGTPAAAWATPVPLDLPEPIAIELGANFPLDTRRPHHK
jgi:hypothetical protein